MGLELLENGELGIGVFFWGFRNRANLFTYRRRSAFSLLDLEPFGFWITKKKKKKKKQI